MADAARSSTSRECSRTPRVSIVFVTYNSGACVGAALASVRSTLPGSEVIVVDNASTDGSVAIAEQAPGVRVIALHDNIGFGSACNVGAREASAEHVLFANPDVLLQTAEHRKLERELAVEQFGLLAPALVGPRNPDCGEPQLFAETGWVTDCVNLALGPLLPRELRPPARFAPDDARAWASAPLLMVRKSEFQELGGFDERFFLYYEDRELSSRYRRAGLPIRGTAALTGRHVGGGSSAVGTARAVPRAWSILGWLQYLCIVDGDSAARRAWRVAAILMGLTRFLVEAAAHVASTRRASRKATELRDVRQALKQIVREAAAEGTSRCPDARAILGAGAV